MNWLTPNAPHVDSSLPPKTHKFSIQTSDAEYDCSGCIQCVEGKQQYNDAIEMNNNLQSACHVQIASPKRSTASKQTVHVNLKTFVTQQLGNRNETHAIRLYNEKS